MQEIVIDGYSIYIEDLPQTGDDTYHNDSVGTRAINWTVDKLKAALKPATLIMNALRGAAEACEPDEMELSMQVELALNGETPVLKIASAGASYQIAVKFVWKKSE